MTTPDDHWEERLAALWAEFDATEAQTFIARMDALAAELPSDAATGLFERGGARDTCGFTELAIPLYKAALENGLTGLRRRRANIQMASSIRHLGDPQTAADLLFAEMQQGSKAVMNSTVQCAAFWPWRWLILGANARHLRLA